MADAVPPHPDRKLVDVRKGAYGESAVKPDGLGVVERRSRATGSD